MAAHFIGTFGSGLLARAVSSFEVLIHNEIAYGMVAYVPLVWFARTRPQSLYLSTTMQYNYRGKEKQPLGTLIVNESKQ